jgi:hypothetical protein
VWLGVFTSFESERCRWRMEHGDDDPACTTDEYGRRRRRGWVNLRCNPYIKERARLVAATQPATCDYQLTVHSPEVCGPPPPLPSCNGSSLLAGITAQHAFFFNGQMREFTLNFYQVRAIALKFARMPVG